VRIMSLDPSLNHVGFALYDNKELVNYGSINSKGATVPEKIMFILEKLPKPDWTIDVAVIELAPSFTYNRSTQFGRPMNAGAMGKLYMATGALIGHCGKIAGRVELVEVNTWKGKQSKEVTQESARLLYVVEVNDHLADEFMMGHFFLSKNNIYGRIKGPEGAI